MRNPLQNAAAGNTLKSPGDTPGGAGETPGRAGDTPGGPGHAAASLAELVTYRTVSFRAEGSLRAEGSSRAEAGVEPAEFEAFIAALPRLYPAVHAGLELERVNGHALLYRWPGRALAEDPAAEQRASVLMAHYDVVPAGARGRPVFRRGS